MALFIAVGAAALPLGWLQARRLNLKHQLVAFEGEGCKVSYQDNGLWITAPQVEVAMGRDQAGGMRIGSQSVSPAEAGERLTALHNQLRLLVVADKTIRIITTDERTGQKSDTTTYIGKGDGPTRIWFNEKASSSPTGRQRRAQRKKTGASQAPSSSEKN
ncbi:hypothetical protein [Lacipirellula parvula]|nr:hypothetical protein [Lacipirellula parvula]